MPEFIITKALATIKKVNPRKEKHGDKLVLAADLKFYAKVPAVSLTCFDLEGQSVHAHFWDSDGRPRFSQICGLTFEQKFDFHVITIGAKEYRDVLICKVTVNALEGNVAGVTFTVQLRPSKQQMGILCDLAEEQVEISTMALQGDLLEQAVKDHEDDQPKSGKDTAGDQGEVDD